MSQITGDQYWALVGRITALERDNVRLKAALNCYLNGGSKVDALAALNAVQGIRRVGGAASEPVEFRGGE